MTRHQSLTPDEAAPQALALEELQESFNLIYGRTAGHGYVGMMTCLIHIGQAIERELTAIAGAHGVARGDFPALNALRLMQGAPVRPTDLARMTGVTLAATTGRINRLAEAGLVARQQNGDDQRETFLLLTEAGAALADGIMRQVAEESVAVRGMLSVNRAGGGRLERDLLQLFALVEPPAA